MSCIKVQKAAADPGSEGPQSKRSLTNIRRWSVDWSSPTTTECACQFGSHHCSHLPRLPFSAALSLFTPHTAHTRSSSSLLQSLVSLSISLTMRLATTLVALGLFGSSLATSETQK
jgi:hypothetical protein